MDVFQRLNIERRITVVLITHENDIAEHGTRLVRFRDGRIQVDQQVAKRRIAAEELRLMPPPDEDLSADVPAAPTEQHAQ
jgi:putative ABC transport system ATP-binding protein